MALDAPGAVGIDDVRAARDELRDVVLRTPVEESTYASDLVGGRVVLKCEHLQRTGSFKIRGAYLRIARLSDEQRSAGVVAASAGNHAQGVALGARLQGVDAVVFMPSDAPIPKIHATRGYGADVRFVDGDVVDCLDAAHALAEAEGRVLVHPYDHRDVVAGQGTMGLELVEQVPDVGTVVVPLGGGGLLAGTAVALRALRPDVRIIGVQAAGSASYGPSLAAGHPVPLATTDTIADGIAVRTPGTLNLPLVRDLVDDIVLVDDRATSRAVLALLERAKQLVEPSGAVGLAALLEGLVEPTPTTVVVLSGGNIDPLVLRTILTTGLAEEGRYLTLRLRIDDRPGSLAALLDDVAALRANVVDVEHRRARQQLELRQVEVVLELETRGPEHAALVLDRLREDGHEVEVA